MHLWFHPPPPPPPFPLLPPPQMWHEKVEPPSHLLKMHEEAAAAEQLRTVDVRLQRNKEAAPPSSTGLLESKKNKQKTQ